MAPYRRLALGLSKGRPGRLRWRTQPVPSPAVTALHCRGSQWPSTVTFPSPSSLRPVWPLPLYIVLL